MKETVFKETTWLKKFYGEVKKTVVKDMKPYEAERFM